jgi:Domain of unknown function (DUF4357)
MVVGKSISIYLADGIPNGILTSEIGNWTGKVIVAPRTQLPELSKREESKRIGVYFLIGEDPEEAAMNKVYVGKSTNIFKRLQQHEKDENKDFWTKTVLIISKDENLHTAHIEYLEGRLIEIIKASGRAKLENGTLPVNDILPESQISDMEFFLSQLQLMLPVLSFDFVLPRPQIRKPPHQGGNGTIVQAESPMFVLNMGGECNAHMKVVNDEFVVLKGSLACKQPKQSWTSYRPLRERLIQEKRLMDTADGKSYEFAEDISFKSPSAASSVVYACNTSGPVVWKIEKTGQTYKVWNEERLKSAGIS